MRTYRAFFLSLILVAVAPAQHHSGPPNPPGPTYKLEGRIIVEPGDWIQTGTAMIVDPETDKILLAARPIGRSEAFAFSPLPAGTYTLMTWGLHRNGGINTGISTHMKVVLDRDLTDVELPLRLGNSVPISVRNESPHPLGPCWWEPLAEKLLAADPHQPIDCSGYTAASVELVSLDSKRLPYLSGAGVRPDPTHFTIFGVEQGKYQVRVELPGYPANYVQSMRWGDIDLLHGPLDVSAENGTWPIEIAVRDDFAILKVRAGKADQRPLVVLLRGDIWMPKPQLQFRWNEDDWSAAVAPGSYTVFAFDSQKAEILDPEFLSQYADRSVHVTLSAKEKRTIDLDVIQTKD